MTNCKLARCKYNILTSCDGCPGRVTRSKLIKCSSCPAMVTSEEGLHEGMCDLCYAQIKREDKQFIDKMKRIFDHPKPTRDPLFDAHKETKKSSFKKACDEAFDIPIGSMFPDARNYYKIPMGPFKIKFEIPDDHPLKGRIPRVDQPNANSSKTRLELVPPEVTMSIAEVFTWVVNQGKYEARDWENGISWMDCLGSLKRHIHDFETCNDYDEETKLLALKHASTRIAMLLTMQIRGVGTDDRVNTKDNS